MKLTHKVGRRMRKYGYSARGLHLSLGFQNGNWWSKGRDTKSLMYSTSDIFYHAKKMLHEVHIPDLATNISVSVYGLEKTDPEQMSIFGGSRLDSKALSDACDGINDRYGDYTIVPALMSNMDDIILDRIAFGSIKDAEGV